MPVGRLMGADLYWFNQWAAPGQYDGIPGGGGGGGGGGGDTSVPLVAAQQADAVVDSYGINIHSSFSGTAYTNGGPNYPVLSGESAGQHAIRQALVDLNCRHVRDKIVAGNVGQQRLYANFATLGIKVNALPVTLPKPTQVATTTVSDLNATVDAAIAEMVARYSGIVVSIEGPNEPNIAATGGYSGTYGGVTRSWWVDAQAVQSHIFSAVNGSALAAIPVLTSAVGAMKDYSRLGSETAKADAPAAHEYPGGTIPSTKIASAVSNTWTNVKTGLVYMTETGYHDGMHNSSPDGHAPTPEFVQAVYAPRSVLELFRSPNVKRGFDYELVDQKSNAALTDHEQHFGKCRYDHSTGTGVTAQSNPTWERKAPFWAVSRLLGLCKDVGAPFTPSGLRYRVTGGDSTLRQVLVEKRDGSHILWLYRDVAIWKPAVGGGTPISVVNQTLTVTLGKTAQVSQYRPSTSATPTSVVNGAVHSVTLGAEVVGLQIV